MSFNDPNFLAAMLGGGIIGAIISALTTIFFGARWVERSRLKREHSTKLVAGALRPWMNHWRRYCEFGAVYSAKKDEFVERIPKNPWNLELFDALLQHLLTQYPEVLDAWNHLTNVVIAHNRNRASFCNTIKDQLEMSSMLPQFNPSAKQQALEEYVIPENVADQVYHALRYEIVNGTNWFGELKLQQVQEHNKRPSNEVWMGSVRLARSKNVDHLKSLITLVEEMIHVSEKKLQVELFVKEEDQSIPAKAENFRSIGAELAKKVELGNCLRGKCKYCPK